jgi:hypothetical protein
MSVNRIFFRVTIVDTGFSTTPPADGFIDNTKVWEESAFAPEGTPGTAVPTSTATGKRKARGAYRWKLLQNHLQDGQALAYFGNVTDTGGVDGTIDSPPTEISFTVGYDKELSDIRTNDELNPGTQLTGVAAVKRMAVRCFCYNYNANLQRYDPAESNSLDAGIVITTEDIDAVAAGGTLTLKIADAETNTTVSQISNIG